MIRASLLDFLNTGCLGPVRPGASMEEIVALLGEPTKAIGEPAPHATQQPYWLYGDLEISFAQPEGAAPFVEFLQIDRPERLRGAARRVAPRLMLDLHGFNARSRPTAFIRAVTEIDKVSVCLVDIAQYPAVTVHVGEEMEINFDLGADDPVETLPPLAAYVQRLDGDARWQDLYVYDPRCRTSQRAREETWPGRYAPFTLTGRDYLAALER
ncbi:hypothetical protein [Ancylobacter polymorphus]|uniref:Uncharacterized protein n=1 Tax=Ancylobacter polymorphus TaxID=223390 RepID=A0ABU0BB94_9HYPH|nr:hypothetical protein [Ancylobacter polymorphus]MDQ0303096.1 hypothetical protein [Ancylobacter polymorphus]